MTEVPVVKIDKLNGNNYPSWNYNAKLVLMERGLWGIANGSEAAPVIKEEEKDKDENVKLLKAWQLRSDKAYSIIALSVEKSIQVHISSTTDPHEAWNILKSQFQVTSVSQIVRLNRRFYAANMEESEDVLKFITRMTSLAQELRELNEDISSKKFATVILGSLPPSYDNFLTSFNSRSVDELNWDNVKSLLIEEYLKRKERAERSNSDQNNVPFTNNDALFTNSNIISNSNRGNYRGGAGSFRGHHHGHGRSDQNRYNIPPQHAQVNDNAMFSNSSSNRGNYSNYRGSGSFRGGRGGRIHGRGGPRVSNNNRNHAHPYNNSSFQGSCYKCGNYGHRATDCTEQAGVPEQGYYVAESELENEENSSSSSTSHTFFHEDDVALSTEFHNDGTKKMNRSGEWYIDSAATRHMTYDRNILMDFRPYTAEERAKSRVHLGDDSIISAVGEGKVRLPTSSSVNGTFLALQSVAFVPELTKNLLSVPAMTKMDAEVRFTKDSCIVVKGEKEYIIGHSVGGKLYCVGDPPLNSNDSANYSSYENCSSRNTWHQRFGHLNLKDVDQLSKSNMVLGMKLTESTQDTNEICEGCVLGKMTRSSFPQKSQNRGMSLLDLVHTDLCGPMQEP